jgi:hypothetical protein
VLFAHASKQVKILESREQVMLIGIQQMCIIITKVDGRSDHITSGHWLDPFRACSLVSLYEDTG